MIILLFRSLSPSRKGGVNSGVPLYCYLVHVGFWKNVKTCNIVNLDVLRFICIKTATSCTWLTRSGFWIIHIDPGILTVHHLHLGVSSRQPHCTQLSRECVSRSTSLQLSNRKCGETWQVLSVVHHQAHVYRLVWLRLTVTTNPCSQILDTVMYR